jgi:hypothetical protein
VGSGQCGAGGASPQFLPGLSSVRLDDEIELETLRGTFKYRVERITVVGPQDNRSAAVAGMGPDLGDVLPVSLRGTGP